MFGGLGKHFSDLIADLRDHREELLNVARDKMKDALMWTMPADIEELIRSTAIYGQEVNAEAKALQRRRTAVVREAIRTVQSLTHSQDYAAVVAAIDTYGEVEGPDGANGAKVSYAVETKSYISQLEQHRDRLLLKIKDMLKEVASETNPSAIKQVLDMVGGEYEELVAEEKEGANTRLEDVLEQAREGMNAMTFNEECGLQEMEDCVMKHQEYPPEVRHGHQ